MKSLEIFAENQTFIFSILAFMGFCFALYRATSNLNISIAYLILIPTGTTMLIIERMNIDIFLFVLIYFAANSANKSSLLKITALLSICAFASIKYFPLILLIPMLIFEKKIRLRITYAVAMVMMFFVIYTDLKAADPNTFSWGYAATYGLKNILGLVNGTERPSFNLDSFPTYLLFVITICVFFYLRRYVLIKNIDCKNDMNFRMFVMGFSILFSSWLINSNYPYRLICVFAMVPYIIGLFSNNKGLVVSWFSLVLVAFGTIPISLSPVRNASLMLSILICVLIIWQRITQERTYRDLISGLNRKTSSIRALSFSNLNKHSKKYLQEKHFESP